MTLAKAFPHLRFCVQDRPKTVELGIAVSEFSSPCVRLLIKPIKAWKERCPDMLESGKAVFQGSRLTSPWGTIHLPTPEQPTTFLPHNPSGTRRYSYYE
jgi:hypothetical protein